MSDSKLPIAEANRSVEQQLLLTNLDTASIFMDIAATSKVEETVRRNHANARKAYDTVSRKRQLLKPDADQHGAIKVKLAALKARLQTVGQQF